MTYLRKKLFIVAFCALCTGCHECVIQDKFEPVLDYYREDPVKRDAAKFLLDNIKYHRSFAPDPYGSYCDEVDSLFVSYDNDSLMALALEKVRDKYDGKLRIDSDANLLMPDYLIRDIDSCVHDWQTLPWLKGLSKEDFYEYYLPYKCVEGQLIDDWRETADLSGKGDMTILNREENALVTARARYRVVLLFYAWRLCRVERDMLEKTRQIFL